MTESSKIPLQPSASLFLLKCKFQISSPNYLSDKISRVASAAISGKERAKANTRGKEERRKSGKQKKRKRESCHVPPPSFPERWVHAGLFTSANLVQPPPPSSLLWCFPFRRIAANDNEIPPREQYLLSCPGPFGQTCSFARERNREEAETRGRRLLKPSDRWTTALNRNRRRALPELGEGWLLARVAKNAFDGTIFERGRF